VREALNFTFHKTSTEKISLWISRVLNLNFCSSLKRGGAARRERSIHGEMFNVPKQITAREQELEKKKGGD